MATLDLTSLNRKIYRVPALISRNDSKLETESFLEELGQIITGAAGPSGATLRRLAGAANVFDGLVGRVRAHIEVVFAFNRRADPTEFGPVVLGLFTPDELIEVKSRSDPGEPIGFGDSVNMIRSDHSASAGHVLDDDRGVAGSVFRHILADEPRPRVVHIAGGIPSHDSDRFTLKKRASEHER